MLKRHTSLNDLSSTRDEQEIEFLRLQVKEKQHVIDDLTVVILLMSGTLMYAYILVGKLKTGEQYFNSSCNDIKVIFGIELFLLFPTY